MAAAQGLEGSWKSSNGFGRHVVIGDHCIGRHVVIGDHCAGLSRSETFVVINERRCATEIFGQRCCGELTADGAAICWEDGRIWFREASREKVDKPWPCDACNDPPHGCEEECICTVCFEEVAALGGAVSLPCDCKALYCHACWDRALNAKFDQTKIAQCPTCRCSMRVDFDEQTGWLRFTKATPEPDPDMRARLQNQTRPFQIGLLHEYGDWLAEQTFSRAAAGRARDSLTSGPPCICGNHLVLTSVRDRILAFAANYFDVAMGDAEKDERVLDLTEKFVNGYYEVPLTCDICECIYGAKRVEANDRVWTCQAGNTTLLHGLSCDVCEACYACHVGVS